MEAAEVRDMADVLRTLRSEVDGLWAALRGRPAGGGGGGGVPGPPGQPGAAAGFGTPGASASGLPAGSNPTASIVASGPDTAKIFQFAFGIPAGQQGPPGQPGGSPLPGPATTMRYGITQLNTDGWGLITVNFSPALPAALDCLIVQAFPTSLPQPVVYGAYISARSQTGFSVNVTQAYAGGAGLVASWPVLITYLALGH